MARILIIDDEAPTRENLQRYLQMEGHTVVVAENGNLGLSQAHAELFDLILCDIMMPGLTGFEVLAHVRAEPALTRTPFIFLTGSTEKDHIARGLQMGAADYITKPFSLMEVGALINKRLGNTLTKIVVAEDEEAIRNNLLMLLRIEGFEAFGAADGQEALTLIREHLPLLVLSDIMMPVMDGHALLTAMRADTITASIPLVFLTSMADRNSIRDSMNLGADDYITKPFHRDELISTVRARLTRAKEQRDNNRRLQLEAKRLLYYDPLTRLPNQTLLGERLKAALAHIKHNRARLALIMVGLDNFGRVNDSLNREAGDNILRDVADRLLNRVNGAMLGSSHNLVARVGGDRFTILLEGFDDDALLDSFSGNLLNDLSRPYPHHNQNIYLSACVGIAVTDAAQTGHSESLCQQAEAALRQAKLAGPGSRLFFSGEINQVVSRRMQLHNELHRALELGQLSLHYQPQIDIRTNRISGCEALMRWQHPELGSVSPAEFIPVAEESGLIIAMGNWALQTACSQAKAWLDAGMPIRVAVNLSARQVAHGDILKVVSKVLDVSALPPEYLELEITESVAMHEVEALIGTMTALKAMGVALAMDDFGTGYSSLSYLKRFPLDVLKIDQSFVRNLTTDPGDASITRAVTAMAHSFGLSVIAEGVETEEHLEFLTGLGCEVAQGYLFSKPLSVADFTDYAARKMTG